MSTLIKQIVTSDLLHVDQGCHVIGTLDGRNVLTNHEGLLGNVPQSEDHLTEQSEQKQPSALTLPRRELAMAFPLSLVRRLPDSMGSYGGSIAARF